MCRMRLYADVLQKRVTLRVTILTARWNHQNELML